MGRKAGKPCSPIRFESRVLWGKEAHSPRSWKDHLLTPRRREGKPTVKWCTGGTREAAGQNDGKGRTLRVTKREEGSLLDAQGHRQSRGDDGHGGQVSGILSYLLPLPYTHFQRPNTLKCHHHRGLREKCASPHPMEKNKELSQH